MTSTTSCSPSSEPRTRCERGRREGRGLQGEVPRWRWSHKAVDSNGWLLHRLFGRTYAAGALSDALAPEVATDFVRFLDTPAAKKIFVDNGVT